MGHVAPQHGVQVQLAPLLAALANRQHVLDPLREPVHDLAHALDLVLGQIVEALLEEALPPELLHVVEVLLLELALGIAADTLSEGLQELLDQLEERIDLGIGHPGFAELLSEITELPPRPLAVQLLHGPPGEEPDLEHVLDALDPGLVRGIADHLLELREILGEQRLGEL